jgi:hypothetical protein
MVKLSLKTVIYGSALLALSLSKQTLSINIPQPKRILMPAQTPRPYAHHVPAKKQIQKAQRS